MPANCPTPDEISLGVGASLPSVDPSPQDPGLQCVYYNAAAPANHLMLTYGPAKGMSTAEFHEKVLAAAPGAVAVPGVGDAAYYFVLDTKSGKVGGMYFLSGAVGANVFAPIAIASQQKLTHLVADILLVP